MSDSYRIGPPGQRREIDVRELKQHVRLSTIVERRVKLRRSGNALLGLCPFAPVRIDPDTGAYGPKLPAMIAACQDVDGSIMGIQRTFLTRDGTKARMNNPRLSLGQIRGGALRLEPEAPTITLCEGIEDGLSLVRMFPGMSVWVALGAGNLPFVSLPPSVRRVVLAGDTDAPGQAAVAVARDAYEARRIEVETIFPRAATDFNEEWLTLHV